MKLKILSVCGQTVASYDEESDQSFEIKYSNCMLHHLSCRNAILSAPVLSDCGGLYHGNGIFICFTWKIQIARDV